MRSAVSTRPLRAPGVWMKYSSIDRPSRKLDLIGRGIMSPRGLATRPRMPAIWRTCIMFPRAPEPTIMSMGLNCSERSTFSMASRTCSVASVQMRTSCWRRSPSVMMPRRNCVSTLSASFSNLSRISFFWSGVLHVLDGDRETGLGRVAVGDVLDVVEGLGDLGLGVVLGQVLGERARCRPCASTAARSRSGSCSRPGAPPRTGCGRPWSCAAPGCRRRRGCPRA